VPNEKRLSFSGFKTWKDCPQKYKLTYIDGHREPIRSIYIDFGSAIHEALEHGVNDETRSTDMYPIFEKAYDKLVIENRKLVPESYKVSDEEWKAQAKNILSQAYTWLDENFPGWEPVSSEEELHEPIVGTNWNFKGYIDLVIAYKKKFWIIDWKSTTWGWQRHKKQDEILQRQVQLYKHYWCVKHDADPKQVNCAFVLLKRTPKNKNIELVRASGSPAKLETAVKGLRSATSSIERKMWLKNWFSCTTGFGCEFYQTELCP